MVVKVYISLVSASNEIKKRQQRAQLILDSLSIPYEIIDITEPGNEKEKQRMQTMCKKKEQSATVLPPQFFNDEVYCGDYEDFDSSNDEDMVKVMLKLEDASQVPKTDINEEFTRQTSRENSTIESY